MHVPVKCGSSVVVDLVRKSQGAGSGLGFQLQKMAKTFTLLETITISAVFSAVSSWYGFMIGRENARRELGAIIDELRNSTSRASQPPSEQ